MRCRALFVASEAFPLVKTGGLADYAAGLTKAMLRHGDDMRLLLPAYLGTARCLSGPVERIELGDLFGFGDTALISGHMPDTRARVYLIDCPNLYARPGGIYQDATGDDWPDNAFRFGLLARVAAWLALGRGPISWQPDVVHLNDWQTGLVATMLALQSRAAPPTLFTIHNMAFQGLFDANVLSLLDLPMSTFDAEGLEFFGKASFLKAGIRYADRIVTVSEAYAREILTPEAGFGLEGLLQHRANDIVGILNGADYEVWNPRSDAHIAAQFGPDDLAGKVKCKEALRKRVGLPVEVGPEVPLFAYVSRLTHQKMADILMCALPEIFARGAQAVVLGRGERSIEAALSELAQRFPAALAVKVGYDEELAHQVLAGADILIAPARFEPCGLTQMYALRYGTVPIVSRVGGLRETVIDAGADALEDTTATGFVFEERTLSGFLAGVDRALAAFRTTAVWRVLQRNAMVVDFSWDSPAMKYHKVYEELIGRRPVADGLPSGRDVDGIDRAIARKTDARSATERTMPWVQTNPSPKEGCPQAGAR